MDTVTQRAAADHAAATQKRSLSAIKGAVVPQQISLHHPSLRKTFKHTYELADSHLYFILGFCRNTLPEQVVAPITQKLQALIAKAHDDMDLLLREVRAAADGHGVTIGHHVNDQTLETQASTPLSKRYLEVFKKSDDYLVVVDSLWIEGILDDEQHGKSGPIMSRVCHDIHKSINEAFRWLLDENSKRRLPVTSGTSALSSEQTVESPPLAVEANA